MLEGGGYKSAAVYYSAVVGHQMRTMWQVPSPELRRCIQDTRRAILRGAGPHRLKDFYDVPVLKAVLDEGAGDAFCVDTPSHMADVMLACAWWMLREIESAGAQICHLIFNEARGEVTLMLPVQKSDQRGLLCCRTLLCACRVARQILCPYHCMKRHMARIRLLGADATSPRAPLFPSGAGGVLSKEQFIRASRATLRACGVETLLIPQQEEHQPRDDEVVTCGSDDDVRVVQAGRQKRRRKRPEGVHRPGVFQETSCDCDPGGGKPPGFLVHGLWLEVWPEPVLSVPYDWRLGQEMLPVLPS